MSLILEEKNLYDDSELKLSKSDVGIIKRFLERYPGKTKYRWLSLKEFEVLSAIIQGESRYGSVADIRYIEEEVGWKEGRVGDYIRKLRDRKLIEEDECPYRLTESCRGYVIRLLSTAKIAWNFNL